MLKITIYTKNQCPYCVKAKKLFEKKQLEFNEIKVETDEMRNEVIKKSGGRMTVPQIFINEKHIGGYDDLYAIDASGELDTLINS
jgi:glutaredoxin 3